MGARFEGKVALVTGAATGIGRATALAFAQAGADVAVSDVNPLAEETVGLIRKQGRQALFVPGDVAKPADVEKLVKLTVERFGKLDCAFNNAGIEGVMAPLVDYPEEMWNRVIAVNLTGVMLCMKQELKVMGTGSAIVNNASILGTVGFANASAYTAAKHGVLGLTKVAALENGPRGVRINAVCPGFIETPMLERAGITSDATMKATVAKMHAVQRMGRSEEISAAVLWLCSPEASFVTGHPLLVDGGYVAQ